MRADRAAVFSEVARGGGSALAVACAVATTFGWAPCAAAQATETSPGERERAETYHLFNPVPREKLRELSTDRPDTTESPYTVDAGHFQLEMTFVALTLESEAGASRRELAFASTNLKAGLTSFMDLQLIIDPYYTSTVEIGDETLEDSGYGATTLRVKLNLWGNDGGATALGLMPFVTIDGDAVDFGLIVPFAGELPLELEYGLMLEGDVVEIDPDGTPGLEIVMSATIGREIVGMLGGYLEIAGMYAAYDADASTLALDTGVTLGVLADLQLDAGAVIGLAGAIEDVQLFVGVAARL